MSFGGGQSMVVGRGLVEILPDFRKWGAQLATDMKLARTQLDGSAAGLKRSAATVGTSMAKIGKTTSLVGLGVAAASVKMAADFQAHTAVLQTAAGETASGLKVVRAGILNIAQGTGTGIQNLTDGMYQIEKAGFRGSDGLKVLQAAAQGAREENAKLSDVTNAMTSVMASYHLKATDSVRVMNAMKTAAGEGKITMEDFSGALSTVLPIASANHIAFEDIAGSMATLTQHGTSAREATHELSATIRALASPNLVASREMARFGLSAVDVSKNLGKRGLSGTVNLLVETITRQMGPAGIKLQKLLEGTKQSSQDASIMLQHMTGDQKALASEYLKGNMLTEQWNAGVKGMPVASVPALRNFKVLVDRSRGFSRELKNGGPASQTFTDALKKMSGGAIGLNTILQITGESAAGNAERIKKVGESFHNNSKDVEGWKVTAKLLNVQMDRMKAQFQVIAITIGTKLIPVVSAATAFFVAHKAILVAIVAAILTFITATAAAYIGLKLYSAYTMLASAATGIYTAALWLANDGMIGMRIGLAAIAVQEKVVAVWTAITSTAFWGLAAAILANPITWIVVAVVALVAGIVLLATKTRFFQTIWAASWGFIKKVFFGFVNWFKENWQLITFTILTGGMGLAVAMIVRHWQGVKHAFSVTIDWVKHNWPLLLSILLGPIAAAAFQIYKHWDMISKGAGIAYHAVINWFSQMATDVGHFFMKIPGVLGSFFSKLPGEVGGWLSGVGSAIGSWFSKLPGEIAKTATGFGSALKSSGIALIQGLLSGAANFFTKSIPSFFVTIWHGLVDYFKAVFGIKSPSTVFAAIGVDLIRGLLVGMLKISSTIGGWLNAHIFGPTVNFFRSAGSWLVSKGKSVLLGLISGQLAVARTIGSWFSAHVLNPTVNFFRNAGSWLVSKGRSILVGLISGQLAIARTLAGWFSSHVKNPVIGAFRSAGSWLTSRGRVIISGLISGATSGLSAVGSWAKKVYNAIVGAVKSVFGIKSPSTEMAKLGVHMMSGLLNGLMSKGAVLKNVAKKLFKSPLDAAKWMLGKGISVTGFIGKGASALMEKLFGGPGHATGSGGAGVARWTGVVQQALRMVGQPAAYTAMTLRRMNQESGGNPTIVNKWDSNWKAGHPSVGLMQVIAGTFKSYAGSMRKTGPFEYGVSVNPLANVYAAMRYALSAYGSLPAAFNRAGGYDQGGIARGIGYMPKWTNQPERVLSPRQTAAFERLVGTMEKGGPRGGGGTVLAIDKLVIDNHGVIGSRLETENWLVTSLDTLRKKGRIK